MRLVVAVGAVLLVGGLLAAEPATAVVGAAVAAFGVYLRRRRSQSPSAAPVSRSEEVTMRVRAEPAEDMPENEEGEIGRGYRLCDPATGGWLSWREISFETHAAEVITVAGIAYRGEPAQGADLAPGRAVHFEPEPDNPYDGDAIKIVSEEGAHAGYVRRDDQPRVRRLLTCGVPVQAWVVYEWRALASGQRTGLAVLAGCAGAVTGLEGGPLMRGDVDGEPPATPEPTAADEPSSKSWADRTLEAFYTHQQTIEVAKRDGDLDRARQAAVASGEMLADFVAAWRVEKQRTAAVVGEEVGADWFDIRSIVAVETLCQLAPARGDRHVLEWLRVTLAETPQLTPWIADVDQALEDVVAAERVTAVIAEQPGVAQAGLAKQLGLDGHRVRSILYWMERDGRLRREPDGRTYALYLTGAPS